MAMETAREHQGGVFDHPTRIGPRLKGKNRSRIDSPPPLKKKELFQKENLPAGE
jgi:hypothetical protein